MIDSTVNQPKIALFFLSGGIAAGFIYVLIRCLSDLVFPHGKYAKRIGFFTDALFDFTAVIAAGALFIVLTDRNYGEIEFFTVLSFLTGLLVAVAVLRGIFGAPMAKIIGLIRAKMHNYFLSVHNNRKRREDERKRIKEAKRAERDGKGVRQVLRKGVPAKERKKDVGRASERLQKREGKGVAFRL